MKLEDVAKRAKVSIATVSRVLNNAGPVRNTTKSRVLKAVQDLKYHPNIHARTLAGGRSRTLGMIVSIWRTRFSWTFSGVWNRKRVAMLTRLWWPTPTTTHVGW